MDWRWWKNKQKHWMGKVAKQSDIQAMCSHNGTLNRDKDNVSVLCCPPFQKKMFITMSSNTRPILRSQQYVWLCSFFPLFNIAISEWYHSIWVCLCGVLSIVWFGFNFFVGPTQKKNCRRFENQQQMIKWMVNVESKCLTNVHFDNADTCTLNK